MSAEPEKFGNTIDHSNVLFKTYNPVDLEKVRQAEAARREGRRRKNKAEEFSEWAAKFGKRTLGKKSKWLIYLERVKGIEPSYSAWKAAALPLSYTRAAP